MITGATGFVGSQLIHAILDQWSDARILAPVRIKGKASPDTVAEGLLKHWQAFHPIASDHSLRLQCVDYADLESCLQDHGIHQEIYFFHAAAATDFGISLTEARRDNVFLTQSMINLARRLPGLRRFTHVSTAFACGRRRGMVREDDPPGPFNNYYEQSKFESEQVVRYSGLPYTIVRPSVIVGNSRTGYVRHFRVFYSMFRLWLSGRVPRAPIDIRSRVDVIPIDYVINHCLRLAESPFAQSRVVHICAGQTAPSPAEILRIGLAVFEQPKAKLAPQWIVHALSLPFVRPWLDHGLESILMMLRGHFPYMGSRDRTFDTSMLQEILGDSYQQPPAMSVYGVRLFEYCRVSAWGKRPIVEGAIRA